MTTHPDVTKAVPVYGPGRMNRVGHYRSYDQMARAAMQHMMELHAPVTRWVDVFDWSRDR